MSLWGTKFPGKNQAIEGDFFKGARKKLRREDWKKLPRQARQSGIPG
jgi:hypothetical protein